MSGLYDPGTINDRLLLGLKGTMSEVELHLIRATLQGGSWPRRPAGSWPFGYPSGWSTTRPVRLCWTPTPVSAKSSPALFATFEATGSASAVVKASAADAVRFPGRHVTRAARRTAVLGAAAPRPRAVRAANPRHAGAYVYGRRQVTDAAGRHHTVVKPRDQWTTLILGAHPGYIDWDQFQTNQATLAGNAPPTAKTAKRPGP